MMISVTDLCDYLWCPYQVYLKKVKKIRPPPSPAMVKGIVIHKIREETTKREKILVKDGTNERSSFEDVRKIIYGNAYQCAKNVVMRERKKLEQYGMDHLEILSEVKRELRYDCIITAAKFKRIMDKAGLETALDMMYPEGQPECMLEDREMGLRGRIDHYDRFGDICIPIDYKSGKHYDEVTPSQIMQISAYAILMERKMNANVPLGIIEYTQIGRMMPVIVDENAKKGVYDTLERVKKIILEKKEPEKNIGKRCNYCSFREHCI